MLVLLLLRGAIRAARIGLGRVSGLLESLPVSVPALGPHLLLLRLSFYELFGQ